MALRNEVTPIENFMKDITKLEQYVACVVGFTSKYNSKTSRSYAPHNLENRYEMYPSYGDFLETYVFRTYGKWWRMSEGAQQNYMPNDVDPYDAEDFITLVFRRAVIPRDICVYETFNPGAIVRIWARLCDSLSWVLLWEGPPETCPEKSRKFHPQIKTVNYLTREIRLELNHSKLRYCTGLDAVLLGGLHPKSDMQYNMGLKGLLQMCDSRNTTNRANEELDSSEKVDHERKDHFSKLPHEVIVHIFGYLDLKSLSRCARVNKRLYQVSVDPSLYHNLSLKKYWNKVSHRTLQYFSSRCTGLKKLDLSWCDNGDIFFASELISFLQTCGQHLTHLSLGNCNFVTNNVMEEIGNCSELLELRLKNCTLDGWTFTWISNLHKLETLDLYSTSIVDNVLIEVLKANLNLKHLILDFCEDIQEMDDVAAVISEYNKKLITLSAFRTIRLTSVGASYFAKCHNIRELDLGWCLVLTDTEDCLATIASSCPDLRRLILSGWRATTDQQLLPVLNCKKIHHLDLLGMRYITEDVIEKAFARLPQLQLLDISYCDNIRKEMLQVWRNKFPNITIQWNKSYQYDN